MEETPVMHGFIKWSKSPLSVSAPSKLIWQKYNKFSKACIVLYRVLNKTQVMLKPDFQLLPAPEGRRGNERAQMRWGSGCVSWVWPAGGQRDRDMGMRRWRASRATQVTSCDISPRGWGPASVSAGCQRTRLQWGAWLSGSACPLQTARATMTTHRLHSYHAARWSTFWPRLSVTKAFSLFGFYKKHVTTVMQRWLAG